MNIRYWHFLLIALATATGARAQGTGLDEGPSIVIREAAYYPLGMQKAAMEDSVNVWVVIAPSGAVESLKVLGRPFPGFKGAAMLAAWRSQYEPAIRDGVATRDSLLLSTSSGSTVIPPASSRATRSLVRRKSWNSSQTKPACTGTGYRAALWSGAARTACTLTAFVSTLDSTILTIPILGACPKWFRLSEMNARFLKENWRCRDWTAA